MKNGDFMEQQTIRNWAIFTIQTNANMSYYINPIYTNKKQTFLYRNVEKSNGILYALLCQMTKRFSGLTKTKITHKF